ncbi:hypothetical protein IscW_ISCW000762 [Ixodes scapularis]|uniref:Uncharacterized protein n=1 Tax=Ixodes scapularis TaxID=6945 RepID=B7P5L9_IXOSC|nr:hypothetical protein IscW_ISCW000762 [Ixodes scapularis]|eukprot:XP_002407691.1 hypothetical protein IscW_ISCW000762 [Ixodes scapularis]
MFLFSLAAFIVVSFFFPHFCLCWVKTSSLFSKFSKLNKSKLFFFHCHHPKGCDGFSMPCSERNVAGVCNTTALAILPNSVAFLYCHCLVWGEAVGSIRLDIGETGFKLRGVLFVSITQFLLALVSSKRRGIRDKSWPFDSKE